MKWVTLPDRTVEGSNTEDIPRCADPAPQGRVTVHLSLVRGGYKGDADGNNEGDAVADKEIGKLHLPQPPRVELVVERQVDVHSHGKCPERIRRHEPRKELVLVTVAHIRGKVSPWGAHLHLDQESLELAPGRTSVAQVRSCHECGDIGHQVAERGVEDEPVDRLMEGLGEAERSNNEDASKEGQDGTSTLNGAEVLQLYGRDIGGVHGV